MAKKSFLEEELARESRVRKEPEGWLARLLHKIRKDKDIPHVDRAKAIVTAKEADRYGLVLTPNEIREVYEFPTLSDEPQSVVEDSIEMLYKIALNAMRDYGNVAE